MNIPPNETERDQQSPSDFGRSRDFVIPKKTIIGGLILVLLVVALFSGLLNRGYDSKTIRFSTGQVRIRQSASGQLRIPISDTGVYKLWIQGIPDRDGYHVSYTVSWKTE